MSRFEQIGAIALSAAFALGLTGICLAGGGPARIGQYAMGELARIGQAFAGRQPLASADGDPTLPGYFLVLSFAGLLLAIHAVARISGRNGVIPGRALWRWSAVHAVISVMWLICMLWPQVALVGWNIVQPAWGVALVAFGAEFLISVVVLLALRQSAAAAA